ncbi:MAG: membrane dipeptidase [Acidobacteriota bacterium]
MPERRTHGGFHSVLERDHPYIFIDSCMQMWPDADFASAHRHGVTAYGVTAFEPHDTVGEALERLMFWHLVARRHANLLVATSVDDIRAAKREGRAALLLFSQGGDFIERKLHRIEAFYRLGLRVMIPAYNRTNQICGGILDRSDMGLTRFGRLVVEESNRVGLVLDCTHVGRRATLEIIDRSAAPVIFSHSNPSRLAPNPRNIDDEQIRACVARGGIVGLAAWGPLVMRPGTSHWPTLDEFVDMIDYTAGLVGGTAHIGVGTDMSLGTYPDHASDPWGEADYPHISAEYGRTVTPDVRSPRRALDGFSDYPEVVRLAERLLARGYAEADVRGILGENYLRVFGSVWK